MAANASVYIQKYDTPVVLFKQGTGNIIKGHFKIIHIIKLDDYDYLVKQLETTIKTDIKRTGTLRVQLEHLLSKIKSMISQLKPHPKQKRSINWIGSAWKWLAGNPDATDWDNILKSNNDLTDNNNKQFFINRDLYNVTNTLVSDYNRITDRFNIYETNKYEQYLFNKLSIIKDEIYQIVMAYQLAKNGIVQTSLLNHAEIATILSTTQTLPFNNVIEAIENATPTMLIKDSLLLYVISLPQVEAKTYNKILVKPTVSENKKIQLNFTHILISDSTRFGIKGQCKLIKDLTLCYQDDLEELSSDQCLSLILNKKSANCKYAFQDNSIVELVSEGTMFLSNFNGNISYNSTLQQLKGSYIISFYNETIKIDDVEYTNWEVISQQALPPIMNVNLTEDDISLDLNYLHKLHLDNVKKLRKFSVNSIISNSSLLIVIIILIICALYNCKRRETFSFPIIEPIKINYPQSP